MVYFLVCAQKIEAAAGCEWFFYILPDSGILIKFAEVFNYISLGKKWE